MFIGASGAKRCPSFMNIVSYSNPTDLAFNSNGKSSVILCYKF